jgi:hypothetical protein
MSNFLEVVDLMAENAALRKAFVLVLSQMNTWRVANGAYFEAVNSNWINSPKTVDAISAAVGATLVFPSADGGAV